MGPGFRDMPGDGFILIQFRTAPLRGNGHGLPWEHDGKPMSLDAVIRRHGGEGQTSRNIDVAAMKEQKEAVPVLLPSMVL